MLFILYVKFIGWVIDKFQDTQAKLLKHQTKNLEKLEKIYGVNSNAI